MYSHRRTPCAYEACCPAKANQSFPGLVSSLIRGTLMPDLFMRGAAHQRPDKSKEQK